MNETCDIILVYYKLISVITTNIPIDIIDIPIIGILQIETGDMIDLPIYQCSVNYQRVCFVNQ